MNNNPTLAAKGNGVIAAACCLMILSFGYRAGFGLYLQPISEANQWSREVFSFALAMQNLLWGVAAVLAGALADKYGNLLVVLSGVFLYALGLLGMAYANTELAIITTAGILVGAGVAGTSFGIVLPAMVRAVAPHRRAWALGIGTAAGSCGQFLIVPLMQELIDYVGWFQSLQYLSFSALFMTLLALPLAPYSGGGASAQDEKTTLTGSLSAILLNAFKIPSYSLLTLGFFVCGFHVAFITVHMPGYLVDLGFSARIGALSISIIGLCNIIGAYLSGVLSAKLPMRKILSAIYFARVLALSAFLLLPQTLPSVFAFSAIMGFLWLSTIPATSGLVMTFFGKRYMSFLFGVVFLSHQLGSFSGVWLGGFIYENFGNYDLIWLAGIILGLLAAILHLPIKEKSHTSTLQKLAYP